MRKHLLAALLVMALVVSLMTTGAMATGTDSEQATQQVTEVKTNGSDITIVKSLSGDGTDNDPYELTLEAYVSGEVKSASSKPLDIVLVLDTSRSMKENFSTEYSYTVARVENWSYNDINNSSTKYYYKDNDGDYYEVEAGSKGTGNNRTYYLYYKKWK